MSNWAKGGACLRGICAIALLLLGVGTAEAGLGQHVGRDEAFRLPDGSFASICVGNHVPGQDGSAEHCKTCTLSAFGGLLSPGEYAFTYRLPPSLANAHKAPQGLDRRLISSHAQSRGPPLKV